MELEQEIQAIVEGLGLQLYDIAQLKENESNIFRISITSPEGITLDQCADVSRMVAPILDIKEPMRGKYLLEVSSPGIERKLKKIEHLKASVGENIRGKLSDGERFQGELLSFDDQNNFSFQGEDGIVFVYNYSQIVSCATYFNW